MATFREIRAYRQIVRFLVARLLYNDGVVTHEDSGVLVDAEEKHGARSLLLWLSSTQLRWALERRVWEVGASVHFVKRGHYLFLGGEPVRDPVAAPAGS